jgi:hypothetical protein
VEDWAHPAQEPARVQRIHVSFTLTFADGTSRDYVVFHAADAAGQGYVYLPGSGEADFAGNASLMRRGDQYDGHWFRATREWTNTVQSALKP